MCVCVLLLLCVTLKPVVFALTTEGVTALWTSVVWQKIQKITGSKSDHENPRVQEQKLPIGGSKTGTVFGESKSDHENPPSGLKIAQ